MINHWASYVAILDITPNISTIKEPIQSFLLHARDGEGQVPLEVGSSIGRNHGAVFFRLKAYRKEAAPFSCGLDLLDSLFRGMFIQQGVTYTKRSWSRQKRVIERFQERGMVRRQFWRSFLFFL